MSLANSIKSLLLVTVFLVFKIQTVNAIDRPKESKMNPEITSTPDEFTIGDRYIDQSSYTAHLVFEGWTGSYIISEYFRHSDEIRIFYCNANRQNSYRNNCQAINEEPLTRAELISLEAPIRESLETQSEQLIERLQNANVVLRAFRSAPENDSNVRGLREIADNIAVDGIGNWILLKRFPSSNTPPVIETPAIMEDFVSSLSVILNNR